jgi:hypothetical protein
LTRVEAELKRIKDAKNNDEVVKKETTKYIVA